MTQQENIDVDSLIDRGFGQIQDGDFESALKTAGRIEEMCHTAAFEIAALAHSGLDDPESAVKVLQRGIKVAPGVWVNWQLLGNLLSDLGQFEAAEDAFRDALRCEGVWEQSVHLNQAILLGRQGKHEQALEALDAVTDEHLTFEVASARMNGLGRLGRAEEALAVWEQIMPQKPETAADEDAWYYMAVLELRLLFEGGLDPELVRKRTMALLRSKSDNENALTLIRDTRGGASRDCRYFRLVIHGNYSEAPSGAVGFFVPYDAVAETSEEALEFVEEIEAVRGFDFLEVEDCEVLAERTKDPKGVYRIGGRAYYKD